MVISPSPTRFIQSAKPMIKESGQEWRQFISLCLVTVNFGYFAIFVAVKLKCIEWLEFQHKFGHLNDIIDS